MADQQSTRHKYNTLFTSQKQTITVCIWYLASAVATVIIHVIPRGFLKQKLKIFLAQTKNTPMIWPV